MKHVFFHLVLFLLFGWMSAIHLNAQPVGQGRIRLDFSLFWLPQTNWLLNPNDYNAFKEKDYELDYSLLNGGVSLGFYSRRFAGISIGFFSSEQGQTYINRDFENGVLLETYSTQTRLSYYKIPLLFSYKADPSIIKASSRGKKKAGHFFFEFGPQLSLLQEAKLIDRDMELTFLDDQGNEILHADFFSPFNIELVLGIGGNYNLTERLVLQFLVRFDYSLNDIEDKTKSVQGIPFPIERLATNTGTAGILLGFGYKFYGF